MANNRSGLSLGEPPIVDQAKRDFYGSDDIELPLTDIQFIAEDQSGKVQTLVEHLLCRHLEITPPGNVRTLNQIVAEGSLALGQLIDLGFHLAERAVLALEYGKEFRPESKPEDGGEDSSDNNNLGCC